MGRKKANLPSDYMPPPSDLDDAARAVWIDVLTNHPIDMFSAAHTPMLRTYCEASIEAQSWRAIGRKARSKRAPDLDTAERAFDNAIKQERIAQAAARSLRITLQAQRPPPQDPNGQARKRNPGVDDGQLGWEQFFPQDDELPRQ